MNRFMQRALELAEKGRGKVEPNPLVGAVVVKNGRVVGEGFHAEFGARHAEAIAIGKAGRKARGADIYVTLEPCNHYGKRPPCAEIIAKAGIARVFAARTDPNRGSGNGLLELKRRGIKVRSGLMAEKAKKQNKFYITNVGLPQKTTIKIAMTENGFITWGNGKRKKISGEAAFGFVQGLRERNDAVIVGINTVLKDNPRLTVREGRGKSHVRVVLDSGLRIPEKANVFSGKGETIIFTTERASAKKIARIGRKAAVIVLGKKIGLYRVIHELYLLGMRKILVEPGKRLATAFLQKKLFDTICIIVSQKKVRGGMEAFRLKRKARVKLVARRKLGKDTLLVLGKCT